jgi:hypothetical protein
VEPDSPSSVHLSRQCFYFLSTFLTLLILNNGLPHPPRSGFSCHLCRPCPLPCPQPSQQLLLKQKLCWCSRSRLIPRQLSHVHLTASLPCDHSLYLGPIHYFALSGFLTFGQVSSDVSIYPQKQSFYLFCFCETRS